MYAMRCPAALQHLSRGVRLSALVHAARAHKVLHVSTKAVPAEVISRVVADREGSPFHELGLQEIWEKGGKTRVRQHVNPLKKEFQVPVAPLNWQEIFEDPQKPLFVDVGCGSGRFLLLLSQKSAEDFNYFGIEIRRSLVERANKWASSLDCATRVHFKFANATNSFDSMLSSYPGPLHCVAIQFPDPHFKQRHKKRQVFQKELVDAVKARLQPGGRVFLQSDVLDASVSMRDTFEEYAADAFTLAPEHRPENVFFLGDAVAPAASPAPGEQHRRHASPPGSNTSSTDKGPTNRAAEEGEGSSSSSSSSSSSVPSSRASSYDRAGVDEGDCGSGAATASGSAAAAGGGGGEEAEERFESQWKKGGWLRDNPMGVPTEREYLVGSEGRSVYRVLLTRLAPGAA